MRQPGHERYARFHRTADPELAEFANRSVTGADESGITMLVLPGTQALSDFRLRAVESRLRAISPGIQSVRARYLHFVEVADASPEAGPNEAVVDDLFRVVGEGEFVDAPEDTLLLVVPRIGTISPWSSKATDIAHNAGLEFVIRIERGIAFHITGTIADDARDAVHAVVHDRMTETVLHDMRDAMRLFRETAPRHMREIPILPDPRAAISAANRELGLALDIDEIAYLGDVYTELNRNPTDVELMMFAQVNSEHCRHKIFNAEWVIDGERAPKSLFQMIKNTHEVGGRNVLSAYHDNAAVLAGPVAGRFFADALDGVYRYHREAVHTVIKVETHNHPTAIAPFPGAATGSGGEIRDEAATGRGAKTKSGLAGFSVSNLRIPGAVRPWETEDYGKPDRIASALDIMLHAPIGAAAFVNEFGRPNLAGYFRTYEQNVDGQRRGYHKPIMIAGGLGNIREEHVDKQTLPVGAKVIVLGGPAMLIGLGGGAASSMQSGTSHEHLDFASVQRGNGEMERRAQEVIDRCWAMGADNPILMIHDVGAGGLSNALPELVHDSGRGARFALRDVLSAERGLSPLEIWCNEAQERFVLGIAPDRLEMFAAICERERAPFSVVGETTAEEHLVVHDSLFDNNPVDLPMSALFGKPPKMTRTVTRRTVVERPLSLDDVDLAEAIERVLHIPAVGSKKFLITIGDRSVGGMVVRDQMVGPWQVPVSDVAVTAVAFDSTAGEAMTMGERAPLAVIDAPASGRIAVGEAITNILAADIAELDDVKLSANWMAAAGSGDEDENLYDTVATIGEDFCPELGITIPVGKDSLSMRTVWDADGDQKSVTAPMSLIISAFGPVTDVRKTLTPQLARDTDTSLVLVDLGQGGNRLGGSALAQAYNETGGESPDIAAATLKAFFLAMRELRSSAEILAYHDRSDGGLLATVCEMAFAGRCGVTLDLTALPGNVVEKLFNEELGAVLQIRDREVDSALAILGDDAYVIGKVTDDQIVAVRDAGIEVYRNTRGRLESWWSSTSHEIQRLRDNPDCADREYESILDDADPGLNPDLTFEVPERHYDERPKIGILREEGVNGQENMAAAFDAAGFTAVDVHVNDLVSGRISLSDLVGIVACGGFSYGDVLGAGAGWAKTILLHGDLRAMFQEFFERPDTFSLGICNGCQTLSLLKELIPGAQDWPTFEVNESEQFESRLVLTKVNQSPSIFFQDMAGSYLPVPVAHGEGRAVFTTATGAEQAVSAGLVPVQYVDNYRKVTEAYPANPNGSREAVAAVTTPDGRATIMMPHPERVFRTRLLSWHPDDWSENSPWLRMFQNAREWVEATRKATV